MQSCLAYTITSIALIVCSASELSASLLTFQDSLPLNSNVITGSGAGQITNIEATYDTVVERLTFSSTLNNFTTPSGKVRLWDGFWLILSPGPAPSSTTINDFVIFYGDFNNKKQIGSPQPNAYPVLQSFVYSGDASNPFATSPNHFLQAFTPGPNGLIVTTTSDKTSRTASFSIDVSQVNQGKANVTDSDFFGATFGDEIGIWFQPVFQDNHPKTKYTNGGVMTLFEWKKQSWYDTFDHPQNTTLVPEPSSMTLWGLGSLALLVYRRRGRAAKKSA